MNKIIHVLFTGILVLTATQVIAQDRTPQEKQVLQTVQSLFDAMANADSAAAAELFLKGGHAYRVVTTGPDSTRISLSTNHSFIEAIGGWPKGYLERIWDARIRVGDGIATAWTPYDFHIQGEFSHCGINLFSLVKMDDGWKIADITYSVKQEQCGESPLGPVKQ